MGCQNDDMKVSRDWNLQRQVFSFISKEITVPPTCSLLAYGVRRGQFVFVRFFRVSIAPNVHNRTNIPKKQNRTSHMTRTGMGRLVMRT